MAKFYAIKELSTGQYVEKGSIDAKGEVSYELSMRPTVHISDNRWFVENMLSILKNDYEHDDVKFALVELTEKVVEDGK